MPKIIIESGYGSNTQVPFIKLSLPKGKDNVQLTVDEARDLAINILGGAESAIQDAYIIDLAKGLGMDEQHQAAMLHDFRIRRRDRQNDPTA